MVNKGLVTVIICGAVLGMMKASSAEDFTKKGETYWYNQGLIMGAVLKVADGAIGQVFAFGGTKLTGQKHFSNLHEAMQSVKKEVDRRYYREASKMTEIAEEESKEEEQRNKEFTT